MGSVVRHIYLKIFQSYDDERILKVHLMYHHAAERIPKLFYLVLVYLPKATGPFHLSTSLSPHLHAESQGIGRWKLAFNSSSISHINCAIFCFELGLTDLLRSICGQGGKPFYEFYAPGLFPGNLPADHNTSN